jgi:hypothetical protein
MIRLLVSIIISYLVPLICIGQASVKTQDYELDNKDQFSIIGKVNGKLAVCFLHELDAEVKLYNAQLDEDTTYALSDINYKIKNVKFFKTAQNIYLLYEDKKDGKINTYLITYNTIFEQIGDAKLLLSRESTKTFSNYVISSKKNYFTIYFNSIGKDGGQMTYTTFDLSGKQLYTNAIAFNEADTQPQFTLWLNNNAEVQILMALINADELITGLLYTHGKAELGEPIELRYGDNTYRHLITNYNEYRNELCVVMQTFTKKKNAETGIKKIVLNTALHKVIRSGTIDIKGISSKIKSASALDYYVPRKIFALNDGSLMYVAEYYDTEDKPTFNNRDMLGMGTTMPTMSNLVQKQYTYGDMLCVMVDSTDKFKWQKIINKIQVADADQEELAGFTSLTLRDKIVLLFSPNAEGNNLEQASVSQQGDVVYNILNGLTYTNGKLFCRQAVQVGDGELIIPCVGSTKVCFVKLNVK